MSTFTITFGDQAENHVGMSKIGKLAPEGFNEEDLSRAGKWFEEHGIDTTIYDLSCIFEDRETADIDAYILVAKNGLSAICDPDDFYDEQNVLEKDKKALMYQRVVNKVARWNLCFDEVGSEADYENGKGSVVAFNDVPLLNQVRNTLPEIIGEKARDLKAEGNYYYDSTKCFIGWHGDGERRLVIGIRTGVTMPLCYQWFHYSEPVGPKVTIMLEHGDIYIMSEKAVGTDWKRKNIRTLRHAAGCDKYTTYKPKTRRNK